MLLDLAGESLESAIDRIASTISQRLLQHVEEFTNNPETVGPGDRLQLVVQGHIYAPLSPDFDPRLPVVDLVDIKLRDLLALADDAHCHLPASISADQRTDEPHRPLLEQQNPNHSQLHTPQTSSHGEDSEAPDPHSSKRRKVVGGLRPSRTSSMYPSCSKQASIWLENDDFAHERRPRQLQSDPRALPQRRKPAKMRTSNTPRSVATLIASIWKTLYGSTQIEPPVILEQCEANLSPWNPNDMNKANFSQVNAICLKVSKLSSSARALETVIQAYWMDCYQGRIKAVVAEKPHLSPTEARMAGLSEACEALGWTEKELRNRMMIWRGYKEIKDAGGWVSLVFAGPGIYSICKYRIGFDEGLTKRLSKLQTSFEVAADTLQPTWRQLLAMVKQNTKRKYTGHPHSWVVSADKTAMPLASTYRQWDPDFTFEHLRECVIDDCWQGRDPRRMYIADCYTCSICGEEQSNRQQDNRCACFSSLFPLVDPPPAPVQIGRCPRGKNNGLFARCGFDRGTAVGEFVGLVTTGIEGMDVMAGGHGDDQYQIYQRRMGNYTRFINHSCAPNSQFSKFVWLGVERILVVSRGIEAGTEITVDYSPSYWTDLEKECLCGESCCRYNRGRRVSE